MPNFLINNDNYILPSVSAMMKMGEVIFSGATSSYFRSLLRV
jgi:hypothetical protein